MNGYCVRYAKVKRNVPTKIVTAKFVTKRLLNQAVFDKKNSAQQVWKTSQRAEFQFLSAQRENHSQGMFASGFSRKAVYDEFDGKGL
jgi:hypothetical protein